MNNQIILLNNIKYLIDYLKNKLSKINKDKKDEDFLKKIYNEATTYFSNNILNLLSDDIINFDLNLLKEYFNIDFNDNLLKNKSLYFLYEYICYNVFSKCDDILYFLLLGMFDLHTYSNIIYLNDFHIDNHGNSINFINYIGLLNFIKGDNNKPLTFYVYTDNKLNNYNIDKVFDFCEILNIIHIHNKIFINDVFFLDYINIPRYILIEYPNDKLFDDYFDNYYVLSNKNITDNKKYILIFIMDSEFNIIEPYSVKLNYITYYRLITSELCNRYKIKNLSNNELNVILKDENKIFEDIINDIICIFLNEMKTNVSSSINDFKSLDIHNSYLHHRIIYYLHPYLHYYSDNIKEERKIKKDIIKTINNFILSIYDVIVDEFNKK